MGDSVRRHLKTYARGETAKIQQKKSTLNAPQTACTRQLKEERRIAWRTEDSRSSFFIPLRRLRRRERATCKRDILAARRALKRQYVCKHGHQIRRYKGRYRHLLTRRRERTPSRGKYEFRSRDVITRDVLNGIIESVCHRAGLSRTVWVDRLRNLQGGLVEAAKKKWNLYRGSLVSFSTWSL